MSSDYEPNNPTATLSQSERAQLRRTWSQSPAVWRFVPGRGSPKHIRKWLGKQGPAEWHEIALAFDYDNHDWTPLTFIARQPLADRATIMRMVLALDLPALEQQSRRSEATGTDKQRTHMIALMTAIASGFANGLYQTARFQLGLPQAMLGSTKTQVDSVSGSPAWPLPDHAWALVDGHPHHPEYVWDTHENCQRLPFDVWLRSKIRPN